MSEFGTCPLMGCDCVGPEKCAPATLLANHQYVIDRARNAEAVRAPAFCPIASVTSAIVTASSLITPLLLGGFMNDDEEETPKELTDRERVLGNVKIDQR